MKEKIFNFLFLCLFFTLACLSAILIGLGVHYIVYTKAYIWFVYPPIGGVCLVSIGHLYAWIENKIKKGGK